MDRPSRRAAILALALVALAAAANPTFLAERFARWQWFEGRPATGAAVPPPQGAAAESSIASVVDQASANRAAAIVASAASLRRIVRRPANYRMGDYFLGHPGYAPVMEGIGVETAWKRTILFAYARELAAKNTTTPPPPEKARAPDTPALARASTAVCSQAGYRAAVDLTKGSAPNHTSIAVHVRLGDTLLTVMETPMHKYAFRKHVPLLMYRGLGAVQRWPKPGSVTLYYDSTWGAAMLPGSANVTLKKLNERASTAASETFLKTLTEVLTSAGFTVRSGRDGNTADQDFCEMLSADIFVPGGGGYSNMLGQVRRELGRQHDARHRWWCDGGELMKVALREEPDPADRATWAKSMRTNCGLGL